MDEMIYAGFDVGSRTTKLVVFQNNRLLAKHITETGIEPHKKIEQLWADFQETHRFSQAKVVSTGYGRRLVSFSDRIVSEIACQAKGVHYFCPEARTVIDIGGQDSKIILKDEQGGFCDFVMNDKCAAGTGRFLEMAATLFGLSITELGKIAAQSTNEIKMNNTCVVFAESEIISLISSQHKQADLIAAIHRSISTRIKSMMAPLHRQEPIAFTGGVAQNCGMVSALQKVLGKTITVPPEPSLTGAVGAALFAMEITG